MGLTARWCGAYGGEYLRQDFAYMCEVEEDWQKKLVKLGQKRATEQSRRLIQNHLNSVKPKYAIRLSLL
jgi:hypothetical protein